MFLCAPLKAVFAERFRSIKIFHSFPDGFSEDVDEPMRRHASTKNQVLEESVATKKYSGDLESIMRFLWDDVRVEKIINQDWVALTAMVQEKEDDIGNAITRFCDLVEDDNELAIVRFLDGLPNDLFDGMLVELARELRFLRDNEGSVLH